ncbi:MAG: SDR family oxidoreductase [Calditrichaceae bacterium]|nr:SDR family oxidoreductase [Calditrichaceae bacterium]
MDLKEITKIYDFTDKTVVVTGGNGVLGRDMVSALVGCAANVAILDRITQLPEEFKQELDGKTGHYLTLEGDVLSRSALISAAKSIQDKFGRIDCLINGAGGNHPKATTNPENTFFDLPEDAVRFTTDLNLMGTILPSQVFGKIMAEQKSGVILNVSSMNAFRPLTRIPAYSAAKAAVSNFTQWLAVHLAQEYSTNIRVNAIAPGFFLTEQNRFLLTDKETGELTTRGQSIIDHTPMGKFGDPKDLIGVILWLLSDASKFVTGIVVPVDGGFSAFSGV